MQFVPIVPGEQGQVAMIGIGPGAHDGDELIEGIAALRQAARIRSEVARDDTMQAGIIGPKSQPPPR